MCFTRETRSSTISPITFVSIIAIATAVTNDTVTAFVPALRSLTASISGNGVLLTLKVTGGLYLPLSFPFLNFFF